MLKDFVCGAVLRTGVLADARRVLVLGLVVFLEADEVLRAVLEAAVRLTGVFEPVFFVFGFALALVAMFPPTQI